MEPITSETIRTRPADPRDPHGEQIVLLPDGEEELFRIPAFDPELIAGAIVAFNAGYERGRGLAKED